MPPDRDAAARDLLALEPASLDGATAAERNRHQASFGSMRRILLWAARNPWLRQHVPRWRFVRRAVRSRVPAKSSAEPGCPASATVRPLNCRLRRCTPAVPLPGGSML